MSLRSRVDRLQRLCEGVGPEPVRCATCRAPVPSVPMALCLSWEEGLVTLPDPSRACAECGANPPGPWRVALDPSSGEPQEGGPALILLQGDDDPRWTLREWLDRHAGRSFGPGLDAYFAWRRAAAAKRAK